jgi:hypothetical protein
VITLRESQVAAGSEVIGTVAATQRADTAWLVWRLAVADTNLVGLDGTAIEDYVVVGKCRLDSGTGFEFRVPPAGPVSYDGKLFRIVWEIVAGTGREVTAWAALRVVPRSQSK